MFCCSAQIIGSFGQQQTLVTQEQLEFLPNEQPHFDYYWNTATQRVYIVEKGTGRKTETRQEMEGKT